MIIEITYPARCKDCLYCGWNWYIKKDGETGRNKTYWCAVQSNKRVSLRDNSCHFFKLSDAGTPRHIDHIPSILKTKNND